MFGNINEVVEVLNKCFQSVFTREREFAEIDTVSVAGRALERVQTLTEEIIKLLEELDARK